MSRPPTKLRDPRALDIILQASYNNTESPTHFDLDCACESYRHNQIPTRFAHIQLDSYNQTQLDSRHHISITRFTHMQLDSHHTSRFAHILTQYFTNTTRFAYILTSIQIIITRFAHTLDTPSRFTYNTHSYLRDSYGLRSSTKDTLQDHTRTRRTQ